MNLFLFSVLAMKGIDYEYRAVNLIKEGGQQVGCKKGYLCLTDTEVSIVILRAVDMWEYLVIIRDNFC